MTAAETSWSNGLVDRYNANIAEWVTENIEISSIG